MPDTRKAEMRGIWWYFAGHKAPVMPSAEPFDYTHPSSHIMFECGCLAGRDRVLDTAGNHFAAYRLNSLITGAWSLGFSSSRGDLSIQQRVDFSASEGEVQIWSMRRP